MVPGVPASRLILCVPGIREDPRNQGGAACACDWQRRSCARSEDWRWPRPRPGAPIRRADRGAAEDQAVADAGRAQARQPDRGRAADDPAEVRTVEVDIVPASPDIDLTERLLALGANVRYASPRSGDIRAAVPERKLKTVAGSGRGQARRRRRGLQTAHVDASQREQGRAAARPRRGAARGVSALATVTSEGDRTHGADTVRERDRVTGIGTKLCALSNGVNSLAASQAAGELPAVDILPNQSGDGNEGTAMLQILHDLAPGAELGFATADPSPAAFADNIRRLRFQAGCDVIVDDILYYNESPFQDSPIADHWVRPVADWPDGVAETTPGVVGDGALDIGGAARWRDDSGGVGETAGEMRCQGFISADRLRLHAELLGLRQADGCAQQPGAQHGQSRDRDDGDATRPAGHRIGDAVPDAAFGKGFRTDVWDERPEQPLPAQRQQRGQHQQHEVRRDEEARRGLHAEAAGARRRGEHQRQQGQHHRRVAGQRSPARRCAPPPATRRGDRRCCPTPRGSAKSAAVHSWCPPRTPARW